MTRHAHRFCPAVLIVSFAACSATPSGSCTSNGDCLGTQVCDVATSTCQQPPGSASTGAGSTTGASSSNSTPGASTTAPSTGGHGTTAESSSGGTSGGVVVDGLLVGPLVLSSLSVNAGQTLSGSATLTNQTNASVTLKAADIAARPPGGTNNGGPFDDLYDGPGTTITPPVRASRSTVGGPSPAKTPPAAGTPTSPSKTRAAPTTTAPST